MASPSMLLESLGNVGVEIEGLVVGDSEPSGCIPISCVNTRGPCVRNESPVSFGVVFER